MCVCVCAYMYTYASGAFTTNVMCLCKTCTCTCTLHVHRVNYMYPVCREFMRVPPMHKQKMIASSIRSIKKFQCAFE